MDNFPFYALAYARNYSKLRPSSSPMRVPLLLSRPYIELPWRSHQLSRARVDMNDPESCRIFLTDHRDYTLAGCEEIVRSVMGRSAAALSPT
jgi:hypothetical protein